MNTTPETAPQKTHFAHKAIMIAICVLGIAYMVFLAATANHAIIEAHSFRQTQTAISVFYMLKEGLTLNYITPVFGVPWTIPFEAPIYQLSVALFSYISPLGLDANGRIVSALYWAGCLVLGYKILAHIFTENKAVPMIFVVLALASPLYVFWSRTFMIETTALFFGLGFLYAAIRFTDNGGWLTAVLAIICGTFCVLAKATTWPAFVIAGGLYFILGNGAAVMALRLKNLTQPQNTAFFKRGIILFIGVLIALFSGLSWTEHTDAIKEQSLLGHFLTSQFLSQWNFGDMSTRFTSNFWLDTIGDRALPNTLGTIWWVPLIGFAILLFVRKHIQMWSKAVTATLICMGLFLLPMLLFTNLHIQHDYYQTANGIFLIAAAAIIIGTLLSASRWMQGISALIFVAVVAGQGHSFANGYYKLTKSPADFSSQAPHQLALLTKAHVADNGTILVLGLDWSSHFFYYAERKGVGLPLWLVDDIGKDIIADPSIVFGQDPIAGFVNCENIAHSAAYPNEQAMMDAFIKDTMAEKPAAWARAQSGNCTLDYRIDL